MHLIKTFLVPGSSRATERNVNSISADVTDDRPLKTLPLQKWQNYTDLVSVDNTMYNIRTLSENIKLICTSFRNR
jgi:hypothetical protein